MAQPTPVGFERYEPGAPWGDVVYSDGSRTPVEDADGRIEEETRALASRANAAPPPPPPPETQQPLTGAASQLPTAPPVAPPQAPATGPAAPPPPPIPPPPAMPATAPLSPAEKASVTAATTVTPEEQARLAGAAPPATAAPVAPAPPVAPSANPAADVLAQHVGAPPAAPAPAMDGARNPADAAIRAIAPNLVTAGAQAQASGVDAQSREDILGVAGQSLLSRGKAIEDQRQSGQLEQQQLAGEAVAQYYQAWGDRMKAIGDEAAAQRARDEASQRLSSAQQRPIQPHADFTDFGIIGVLLGAAAGGAAEGLSGGRLRNTTLDSLNKLNQEWVQSQQANKSALVQDLERLLGDKNAALAQAKGMRLDSIAREADARKRFARTKVGMQELEAVASASRAQALDEYNKAQGLVAGRVATSIDYAPPKPVAGAKYTNATIDELFNLGITEEEWRKGLDGKTLPGENSPTIRQTADATKTIDEDINFVRSLAAANDSKLPGTAVFNVPKAFIPLASRLGWKEGMKAEQANQLIQQYLTQKAKSYGGVITDSDRKAAELEFGASTEGFLSGLQRLRSANTTSLRSALEQQFVGRGQRVLDILLRQSSASVTPGIQQVETAPFEAGNVDTTGPKTTSEDQRRQELRAAELARGAKPEDLDRAEQLRQEEERRDQEARAAREAEVARRKPVERMKL